MSNAKYISLFAGTLQQTALVLVIHYSRNINRENPYLTSVAVASSEVFKLCINLFIGLLNATPAKEDEKGTNHATNDEEENVSFIEGKAIEITRHRELKDKSLKENENENNDATNDKEECVPLVKGNKIENPRLRVLKDMVKIYDPESIKLIVPAALYLVQNNLLFVALANLSVPIYQVTNQGKLLTTAVISRLLLKKEINGMQYLSITILGLGVGVIHLSKFLKDKSTENVDTGTTERNQFIGLIAVLISCCTSGFAGVYFEFVLKKAKKSLSVHCRNFHLAFWSLLFAAFHILYHDLEKVQARGLFNGFDSIVVLVVIMQGMTGFVVSMMIHHADTVLKGFAISVAAVLATLLSIPLFHDEVGWSFFVGALMVGVAVKMYSYFGP